MKRDALDLYTAGLRKRGVDFMSYHGRSHVACPHRGRRRPDARGVRRRGAGPARGRQGQRLLNRRPCKRGNERTGSTRAHSRIARRGRERDAGERDSQLVLVDHLRRARLLVRAGGRRRTPGRTGSSTTIRSISSRCPTRPSEILKRFGGDIHEGDIFLHNDPYTGGTHLNDVLMLYPVFHDGKLAMFTATRCHWGDVGGMTPGSLSGRVREIYQEGMRIVPTRICERGQMNQAFLDLLFANMRIDARAQGRLQHDARHVAQGRRAPAAAVPARFGGEATAAMRSTS